MKKIAAISICFFVFISFVLNIPFFSAIFLSSRTYDTVLTYHGVEPVVNATRFSQCVIEAFEVCSNDVFYDSFSQRNDKANINGYTDLIVYSVKNSFLEDLFLDTISDLGLSLSPEFDDQFLTYVFELAVVKYYNPTEYYRLLRTFGDQHVGGGF